MADIPETLKADVGRLKDQLAAADAGVAEAATAQTITAFGALAKAGNGGELCHRTTCPGGA
jgi:hypothetical protein